MRFCVSLALAAAAIGSSVAARAQSQPQSQPVSGPASPDAAPQADQPSRKALLRADRVEERNRRWYVTGYVMKLAEARLPAFPYKIVSFTLPFRDAYAVSVAADRVVVPRFAIPLPGFKLRGNSLALEGQVMTHFGRERDTELDAAAVVRSGQFGLIGRTSANVAWGNGFSYAIDSPTDELGREGVRGVDTVHLQYHMSFETEITSGAAPHIHYVLRLHHRSGIYGIISPSRTGSNYLGLGLRFDLAR